MATWEIFAFTCKLPSSPQPICLGASYFINIYISTQLVFQRTYAHWFTVLKSQCLRNWVFNVFLSIAVNVVWMVLQLALFIELCKLWLDFVSQADIRISSKRKKKGKNLSNTQQPPPSSYRPPLFSEHHT